MVLKVIDKITQWCAVASSILIAGMMLIIVYDVIMRYFFNKPTVWVQVVSEYLLVYICFLAAAWILRNGGHIRIGLLIDSLKPRNQALMNSITTTIGTLVCLTLLWQSSERLWKLIREGTQPLLVFSFPDWTIYIVIPVGSLLLTIHFARKIYDSVLTLRKSS